MVEVVLCRNDNRTRVRVGGLEGNDESSELLGQLRLRRLGVNERGEDAEKMHRG